MIEKIRLKDMIYSAIKRWPLVLMTTTAGLVVGILLNIIMYMQGESNSTYVIKTSFAVTAQTSSGRFKESITPDSSEVYLAQKMVDTAIGLASSEKVLGNIIKELDLTGVKTSNIRNALSFEEYKETELITATLKWKDENEGKKILSILPETLEETMVQTLKFGKANIVDEAYVVGTEGGNTYINILIYAILIGFMAGSGICVLSFIIHPTLMNTEDVVELFDLNILGEVPYDKTYFQNKKYLKTDLEDITAVKIQEKFAEIGKIIIETCKNNDHNIIYITSTDHQEGVSAAAVNISTAISSFNKKVCLIDLNLRVPAVGTLMDIKTDKEHSLNTVIFENNELDTVGIDVDDNLTVIPSVLEKNKKPINGELIDKIKEYANNFDFVIIDTPPVGTTADAIRLNDISDYAVYVIKKDKVWISEIKKNIEKTKNSGIDIMGCLFIN